MEQDDVFEPASKCPPSLRYLPELISRAEERHLFDRLAGLEFKPFEFCGFLGKRRIVSFGWRYDFNGGGLQKTNERSGLSLSVTQTGGGLRQTEGVRSATTVGNR